MDQQVTVAVYRRLDNRLQGDPTDSSELAWDLHRRRAEALGEVFDVEDIRVVDWGYTRDSVRTHELVEVVAVVGAAATSPVATAIVGWIGGVLATALTDTAVQSVKSLIARLRRKQDDKQIADFSISSHGRQLVTVYPDDLGGQVSVTMPDGRAVTTIWSAPASELPSL